MSAPTSPLPDIGVRGDEPTTLTEFLDYFRVVVRRKAEGLGAEDLARPLAPTTMTLGGMLKHLAYVEDHWFGIVLQGREPSPPWDTVDWEADGDWDWHSAADDSPEDLFALYDATIARSRAAVEGLDLDHPSVTPSRRQPGHITLRWIVVHMIEEYARHAGHADLLREAIDGETGD